VTGLLLDTHVLLWARGEHGRIGASVRETITDPETAVFFSSASIWEMAIKHALGKLRMPANMLETMAERGFSELPVRSTDGLRAGALPPHHADPFDRMLIAQAQGERLTLVTSDTRIAAYDVPILW
jgi:PIN domain nuclease of toxin-antitoxin system